MVKLVQSKEELCKSIWRHCSIMILALDARIADHPSSQSKVISIWLQSYIHTLANECNLAIIWPKFTSFTFLFVLQFTLQMLPPVSESQAQASLCFGLTWHRQRMKNRAEESEKSSRNSVPRMCTFHGFYRDKTSWMSIAQSSVRDYERFNQR